MEESYMLIGFFVLAAGSELLTIRWHRYREDRRVPPAVVVAMALETLSWAPIWFALTLGDWRVAAVSILGSGLGTGLGLRS